MPSFDVSAISEVAKEQYKQLMPGLDALASMPVPTEYKDKIKLLCDNSKPGVWTRLDIITSVITYHDVISEDTTALIYDCETFVKTGNYPIVAQAISTTGMWCWLHQAWDGITPYTNTLVPVGNSKKVLVAHNAAFDWARVSERFSFNNNISIVDTMSMVNCLHGLDSASQWAVRMEPGTNTRADQIQRWGCAKSLIASYNYCVKDRPRLAAADKKARNIFVQAEDFSEFIINRDELLTYSMLDIIYTLELFQALLPEFISWSNGYEVLMGQSYVADALLPVTDDRQEWVSKCDELQDAVLINANAIVFDYFTELHDFWLTHKAIPGDRLDRVDWRLHKPKGWRKKQLPEGWPTSAKWYWAFINNELSTTGLEFSRLLQLEFFADGKWRELEQHKSWGWHYLKHGGEARVPHANGSDDNVGNILSSDSLRFFDDVPEPVLRSATLEYNSELLYSLLRLFDSRTTWRGFRDRVVSQITNVPVN